jgi:hypothetical protein
MAKLYVQVVGPIPHEQKHYRLPGCHPFEEATKDSHPRPAKAVPGIIIPVGPIVEVDTVDERHEEILRRDHFLKFHSGPGKNDAKEPDKDEADFSGMTQEASSEPDVPAEVGKGKKAKK